jgi:peptidyl-prolyl cis-trans isomerase A (cyclophilin A)
MNFSLNCQTFKTTIVLVLLMICLTPTLSGQRKEVFIIKTSLGNITMEVYPDKAPVTVANFLKYVEAKLYDSSSFFRSVTLKNQPNDSVKIEVIQGGDVSEKEEFAPIPLETTKQTGLSHIDGTVSMARAGPTTATSSFFICINDQPSLDFAGNRNKDGQGFAAFGKVISGMEVVRRIQQLYPDQGQYFQPVVTILSIRRK